MLAVGVMLASGVAIATLEFSNCQHVHRGRCCCCCRSLVLISATLSNYSVLCLSGEVTEEEKNLSRTLMKYWANFARNG